MNDIRANYVCTLCSQTFTRKPSAERHRINLHFGTAPIVRVMDYIIGRIESRYKPGDPLLYRRRNKIMKSKDVKPVNEVPPSRFTVIPDKTKESSQDDFWSGYKRELFGRSLDINGSKMDSMKEIEQSRSQWSQRQQAVYQKASPSSDETSSSRRFAQEGKLQEFADLVQRLYSKDTAKELLVCAFMLDPKKLGDGWLDSSLFFLRNYDKIVTSAATKQHTQLF
jgi:hypothetical protein